MDNSKTLNCEKSSELNASCKKENVTENLSKIRSREVAAAIESEQETKDICKEREYVKDKPDDTHTRSDINNYQQADILAQLYEADLYFSSLNGKKKNYKKVSRTNPVKIQKNIKFGRVEKGRTRTESLRRQPLQILTENKYFSQTDECFELSYKSNKSQSELKYLQDKSRIADDGKEGTTNESIGSFVTKSSFLNIFQFQPASSNRSQEVSTKKNQPSGSALSTSAPIIPYVTATKSQSPKVKSAKEVWAHFIWFLQANKESFNAIRADGISRENMDTSEYTNHSLKDPTKTARNSTSQSLVEPIKTKTDYVTTEIPNNLKREISATRDANSVSVLKMIQQIRFHILRKIIRFEKLLRNIKVDGQQEKNMVKRIKCLTDAKDLKSKSQLYFDILCDHQKIFNFLKRQKIYSSSAEINLSNPTSLTDLPLSARHIQTFSSLFLYQYKSLYSEVPIENIFKRINSKNYVLAYRRYLERKVIHEGERKMSENVAIKLLVSFNVSLEECRLKMKHEISHSENRSLEDYQNYFNDLRIGITENLNCLKELVSAGSSVVFPVVNYLSESRIKTLQKFFFLEKSRPDVFP